MKQIISLLAFVILFISNVHAQGFFRDRMPPRPNISPLIIVGIVSGGLGCGAALIGLLVGATNSGSSSNSGQAQENSNTSNVLMGTGAALILVGGGLAIAGVSHDHKKRWGVVAQKKNELGLAYNFR